MPLLDRALERPCCSAASASIPARAKPFMIVGIDEKVTWDDEGKTILSAPRQGLGPDRRSRRSRRSQDRGHPAAEEFGGRAAGQSRHRPDRIGRAGGGLGRRRQGRRCAEAGAGQQDLRHRPQSQSAEARGHRHRRQAAFGPELQPVRQDGAGRQPRRQLDQRAVGQRHRRQDHRHHHVSRQRRACDVHAGRQAGAGGEIPRPQGLGARRHRRQGDL